MPDADLTLIAAVLDRSGSMQSMRDDAMGGFNAFLEDQKKAPGDAELTVLLFDDEHITLHDAAKLEDVQPLTEETYVPRGGTALYDAVGRTINVLKASIDARADDKKPSKVIVVIVTDGYENASKEFTQPQVFEQIKKLKADKGWKFIFLAADQNALAVGQSLGVGKSMSAVLTGGKIGARAGYRSANAMVRGLRGGAMPQNIGAVYSQSLAADQGDGKAMSFSDDGVGDSSADSPDADKQE